MTRTLTNEAIHIDLRKRRMDQLVAAVMDEVRHEVPSEFLREIHDALSDVMYRNGVHIMTDQDRAEYGLEARDGLGWTHSERVKAEMRRQEVLMQMMSLPVTFKEQG